MIEQPLPSWQPLSQLPTVAALIDDLGESMAEHRALLDVIRPQPSTLDAATLEGMRALYTGPRQRAVLERYAAQARRWEAQARTPAHRRAVERLVNALARLRAEIAAVVALADAMQDERHEAADGC